MCQGGRTINARAFTQGGVVAGAFHARQVDASVCFHRAESTPVRGTGWMVMANGKWQMANGKWQMANGKWQMASGKWPIG